LPKKWFKPKRHSGFKKEATIHENVLVMLNMNRGNALRAARQALALANVTQDSKTKQKAKAVAKQLFALYQIQKSLIN
jgi:hypothetical protein